MSNQEMMEKVNEQNEVKETEKIINDYVTPFTDIYEDNDKISLVMDIPGVEKSQIDIQIEDFVLTIETKRTKEEYKDMKVLYSEFKPANYFRRFKLANTIDVDKIDAHMENGVLTLTLPKSEKAKPRTIVIK